MRLLRCIFAQSFAKSDERRHEISAVYARDKRLTYGRESGDIIPIIEMTAPRKQFFYAFSAVFRIEMQFFRIYEAEIARRKQR